MTKSGGLELNPYITSLPVVFLTGAGASVPLGLPTTTDFVKRVKKSATTEERELVDALYQAAANRHESQPEDVDLEEIFEYCYELTFALWQLWYSDLAPQINAAIASINRDAFYECAARIERIRRLLLRVLHAVCGDVDGEKADLLWTPLFNALKGTATAFPVFTFNYDWTFEKLVMARPSAYALTDGFSSPTGGNWSAKRFNDFRPSANKMDLVLFKLHGSTCWVHTGDLIKSLGTFSEDDEELQHPFHNEYRPPFEIVYPGHQKELWLGEGSWSMAGFSDNLWVASAERDPYQTLNAYLGTCLRKARVLAVIGYGFRDAITNRTISAALELNHDLRVVVLDPGLNILWEESPYRLAPWLNDTGSFQWIKGKFGTKTAIQKLARAIKERLG